MLTRSLRPNNFDLLRILAAAQVVISHAAFHLHANLPHSLSGFIEKFPGVPVFFVISGFLISASYEKTKSLKTYFTNRALRIFPALWICLAFSILTVLVFGKVNFIQWKVIPWLFAQLSFLQFYNPDFLRSFGTGVLNGSLWTISVELEFYILLPLLYFFFRAEKSRTMAFIILFFVTLN